MINLHVYPSDLNNESRIIKILRTLRDRGIFQSIVVIGRGRKTTEEFSSLDQEITAHRVVPMFAKYDGGIFRFIKIITWYAKVILHYQRRRDVSCINAHSLAVLPLCAILKLMTGSKLIYDTHELETEVLKSRGMLRIIFKVTERVFIRYCDCVIAVNSNIASWYRDEYKIKMPFVVQNMPAIIHQALPKRCGDLRTALGLDDGDLLFIYQGLLSAGRGLDIIISSFEKRNDNKHVLFLGYGPLRNRIFEMASCSNNIHFHDAVPPDEILQITVEADVGFSIIENRCKSYYMSLPNKVFEYISAGLPVIASNFPVMSEVINEYGCGWTIEPSESQLRELLDGLTEKMVIDRSAFVASARKDIGWHTQEEELVKAYYSLGFSEANDRA